MAISFLTLIAAPLALLWLVGLIVFWVLVFRRSTPAELPTRGKCGYAVRGIEALHCPECGSDLREVGIRAPGTPSAIGPATFVIGWTVLWLPATLPTLLLASVLPGPMWLALLAWLAVYGVGLALFFGRHRRPAMPPATPAARPNSGTSDVDSDAESTLTEPERPVRSGHPNRTRTRSVAWNQTASRRVPMEPLSW